MRQISLRAVLGLMVFMSASCRQNVPAPSQADKTTRGTIGISVLTLTNPFFKEIADVFTEEMRKEGYEVLTVSGDNSAEKQQKQVDDFLVSKVSAIVLCPRDSRAIGAAIKQANRAGVPVFTADIACLDPEAKVVTHIATDNYSGGKQAGQAMIDVLGESGGPILLLDFQSVESCILRVKGFKEVLTAHNHKHPMSKITIVKELPCNGDKEIGYQSTEDALQSNPDIVGIFAINDPAALGARAALEKANRATQVKIIGFDGQPEGKRAIREGKIYADPVQHPDQIGRETARSIVRYFQGESLAKEILIPTHLYRQADAEKEASGK